MNARRQGRGLERRHDGSRVMSARPRRRVDRARRLTRIRVAARRREAVAEATDAPGSRQRRRFRRVRAKDHSTTRRRVWTATPNDPGPAHDREGDERRPRSGPSPAQPASEIRGDCGGSPARQARHRNSSVPVPHVGALWSADSRTPVGVDQRSAVATFDFLTSVSAAPARRMVRGQGPTHVEQDTKLLGRALQDVRPSELISALGREPIQRLRDLVHPVQSIPALAEQVRSGRRPECSAGQQKGDPARLPREIVRQFCIVGTPAHGIIHRNRVLNTIPRRSDLGYRGARTTGTYVSPRSMIAKFQLRHDRMPPCTGACTSRERLTVFGSAAE